MLYVVCPNCQLQFQVESSAAGKRTQCGRCATSFHVPSAGQVRETPPVRSPQQHGNPFVHQPHQPVSPPMYWSAPAGATCHYCRYSGVPFPRTRISSGGWVLFAVLLVIFFPLCFLGLLMTETFYVCGHCGAKL